MLLLLLACSAPADERAARLHTALLNENQIWLTRDADLLANKYAAMAADPYDFMRGTHGWWLSDLSRPVPDRPASPTLDDPAQAALLLVGDPHPENLSTTQPSPDALTFEWVDLDGAAYGPYLLDVRRAALGLGTLAAGLDGCDAGCQDDLTAAWLDGYLSHLSDPSDPTAPASPFGAVLSDVADDAWEDGLEEKRLHKYTTAADDPQAPRLRFDAALDDDGVGLLPLTATEAAQAARLLDSYPWPAGSHPLQVGRRYGAGVASRPAVRFLVLYENPAGASPRFDLLYLREVIDAPLVPGLPVNGVFTSNADRVEQAARALWSHPAADPRYLGLDDDPRSFKAVSGSSFFSGVEHLDVQEAWGDGTYDADDLSAFASDLGGLLADAHLRSHTADGAPGADVLSPPSDPDAFVAEALAASRWDRATLFADYQRFLDLLDTYGPLLGADNLPDDL